MSWVGFDEDYDRSVLADEEAGNCSACHGTGTIEHVHPAPSWARPRVDRFRCVHCQGSGRVIA